MNRHHPYRAITNIRGRLVAALFSLTMLGMLPASNCWGEASGHNLNSVPVPYQNILSSLGTPMIFLTGALPIRSIGIGDADGDGHTDLIVAEAGAALGGLSQAMAAGASLPQPPCPQGLGRRSSPLATLTVTRSMIKP